MNIIGFSEFVIEIKNLIKYHQYNALKAVNKELIELYRNIGKLITQKQEKYGWGKSVVKELSKELQKEYSGRSGFSVRNLWYMKLFYEKYKDNEKMQTLSAQISWSANIAIISKCKDMLEREFYIRSVIKHGWSYRVLINHIENNSYEKFLVNQNNFDKTMPKEISNKAKLSIKDEYTFDFLELDEEHSEKELEESILKKVRNFLIEMGGEFAFVGNQYKLDVGGEEFFIDLLLYHRRLKSLVAIELKIGKFKPEYAGKMNFYLSVLNDKVKLPDENPSIGIIICKDKNNTIVEYALKDLTKPIGVSTYTLTKELPKEYKDKLPNQNDIQNLLVEYFGE